MDRARQLQDENIEKEKANKNLPVKQAKTDSTRIIPIKPKTADTLNVFPGPAQTKEQVNTSLTEGADSLILYPGLPPVKKDTIRSIFTLPFVSPSAPGDSLANMEDTAATAGTLEPPFNKDSRLPANRYRDNPIIDSTDSTLHPYDTIPLTTTKEANPPATDTVSPEAEPTGLPTNSTDRISDYDSAGSYHSIFPIKGISAAGDSSKPPNQAAVFTDLFKPYRTFNKQTTIRSTTSLNILQQKVDYKTSADFTTQYQRTGQKSGNFLFDVSVIKLNTEVETMGLQLKYDSNQSADSTSTFAKPLFDIVGKRTFLQVDSTGKITDVDDSPLGRQVNDVLSGLSLSGGDFEKGNNFGLLMSKSGLMLEGQQWSDTVNIGGNSRITTYTIQQITDNKMQVRITGTVKQTGVISSDGAIFKTHFSGTQQGKMMVDPGTLLVRSREITLKMEGTVDYNGQVLPASATSIITEKISEY